MPRPNVAAVTTDADADDWSPWWRDAVVYQVYPRSFAEGSGHGTAASATSAASSSSSTTSRGSAWTPCGCHRCSARRWPTSATTSATTAPSTRCSAPSPTSTSCSPRRTPGASACCSTSSPNHTSDQHPWFVDSRASRDGRPHADWYVWRDDAGRTTGAPRCARARRRGRSTPARGQYYLHCFLPQQPDLDWDVPEVEAAMHDVLRFWLDRGVDGFRMDVVHLIAKDVDHDDPPEAVAKGHDHVTYNDVPAVHERLRAIRRVLDGVPGRAGQRRRGLPARRGARWRRTTAPATSCTSASTSGSCGRRSRRRRCASGSRRHRRGARRPRRVADLGAVQPRRPPPPHPLRRRRSWPPGWPRALLLTLPGTPFLYQGEELGLLDAVVAAGRRRSTRAGATARGRPIPWTPRPTTAGGRRPWLPLPPESRRPQRRRAAGRPAARSCTGTAACWRCAGRRRRCAAARSPCSTTPATTCSPTPERSTWSSGVLGRRWPSAAGSSPARLAPAVGSAGDRRRARRPGARPPAPTRRPPPASSVDRRPS